jgi:predicted DNA-binding protein (UPF0251 family)
MTPRFKKPRHCACPFKREDDRVFKPAGIPLQSLPKARLEHDELDALYLCDSLGLTQEEAGIRMGVSRGTVQRLLAAARKKIVDVLMQGDALVISGKPSINEN